MLSKSAPDLRLKKGLFALALSTLSFPSYATFPDVDSMLQSYRPVAQFAAPQIYTLILALDAAVPYGQTRQDILLTLVPLADGSLWAASEGPMRQINSVIHDRMLRVAQSSESGYTGGDPTNEPPAKAKPAQTPQKNSVQEADKPKAEENVTDGAIEEPVKEQDLTQAHNIKGAWIQVLGDDLRQQERDETPGYHAQVLGAVIGRDLEFSPCTIMGLAGGYQHAQVDQIAFSGSFFEIKRVHGTLYGRHHWLTYPIYLEGTFTFAHNQYDSSRLILVPPFDGHGFVGFANAQYSGWETDAYVETGLVKKINKFRATPKLFLTYAHLDVHGYKESDMFSLNLNVKYDHMDALSLGIGGKFDYLNEFESADVIPEIHAYVLHDFVNDSQVATANFLGGGYAFLSQGPTPCATTYEIGGSLAVHSYKNTSLKIQYDLAARSDYLRQGVFIKIRHEWA